MAKRAPKGAKRKLTNVDLDYVSLVEKPANLTAFKVIKSEDGAVQTEGVGKEVLVYRASDVLPGDLQDPPKADERRTLKAWLVDTMKAMLLTRKKDTSDAGKEPVVEKNENLDAALAAVGQSCKGLVPVSKEAEMSGAPAQADQATVELITKELADKGFPIEKILGSGRPWMAGGKHAALIGRTNYAYKNVLEGITDGSTPSEIVERFADVIVGLDGLVAGDVEKKKDEDDKAYGGRRKKAGELGNLIKGTVLNLLKEIPEELHVLRVVPSQVAGPDQSAGAGAHQDATKQGGVGNAMEASAEEQMKRTFADLLRDTEAKHLAELAKLQKSIEDLGGETRPSTLATGDAPTSVTKTDEGSEDKFAWAADMAGGDVDKSLERVEKAISDSNK